MWLENKQKWLASLNDSAFLEELKDFVNSRISDGLDKEFLRIMWEELKQRITEKLN